MSAEMEALVRWTHPVLGNIGPSMCVPIAEECGLINAIGNWVFREAAACSRRSSQHANKLIPVGINKSPLQFVRQDEHSDWLHRLAIDDFRTGYSSMSYQHKFHIDYLKFSRPVPETRLLDMLSKRFIH